MFWNLILSWLWKFLLDLTFWSLVGEENCENFLQSRVSQCGGGENNLHYSEYCVTLSWWTMSWLRWLVADQLLNSFSFNVWPVDVGFVEDRVALGQVFLQVMKILPIIIGPPMFDTHSLSLTLFHLSSWKCH